MTTKIIFKKDTKKKLKTVENMKATDIFTTSDEPMDDDDPVFMKLDHGEDNNYNVVSLKTGKLYYYRNKYTVKDATITIEK